MKRIFLFSLAALALAACDNEKEFNNTDTKVALQVSAEINTDGPQLRAANAVWEAGDAIGIFMTGGATASNHQYTTTGSGGAFAPASDSQTIWFPIADNAPKVDFVAYYPYSATQTGLSYAVNVANQANQQPLDLLTADKITDRDKTNPAVAFNFRHRLTKLELTIAAGTGLAAANLSGLTVTISGQYTTATCDLNTGAITPSGTAQPLAMKMAANGTSAEATILPAAATSGKQLVFALSSGESFTCAIPADRVFKAGEKHSYAITLNRTEVAVTATITDWIRVTDSGMAN